LTCTDVDENAVGLCAQRLPEARCVLVDPADTALPVGDSSMSLILCVEVMPVVRSHWFAKEAARALAPGGMLVAVVWNRFSARGLLADAASRLRHRQPHPFYRDTYVPWRRQLRDAGFQVRSERGLCWFPFSRASDSPLVPVAVALEKGLGLSFLPTLSPWVIVTARQPGTVQTGQHAR
jgi:SAM-dependent methyltransferase